LVTTFVGTRLITTSAIRIRVITAGMIVTIGVGRMVGIDHRVVGPVIRAAGLMVVRGADLVLRMVGLDIRVELALVAMDR
jgi:hypothetical protein